MTCAVRRGGALSFAEQKVRQRAAGVAFKSSFQARANKAGRPHHNTPSAPPYLATSRRGTPNGNGGTRNRLYQSTVPSGATLNVALPSLSRYLPSSDLTAVGS